MLQMEYINSFNRNYVKIRIKMQGQKKMRYQYQIITTRRLERLLPVSMHVTDGEQALYYEISSTQSLSKWFSREKLNRKWIMALVSSLQTALWSLEQYLLDNRNLILRPDFIFQDMETEKVLFLYSPYYAEEAIPDMEEFLSFLIENVDEKESETAEILYEIYSAWEKMGEQFTVETFLAMWEKCMTENIVEEEPFLIPEKIKEPEPERETSWKKEITEFLFGRHKREREEHHTGIAMESWEYKGETEPEEIPEEPGRTTYVEVSPEAEERKLYGNGKQNRKVICLDKLPLVIGKKEGMTDVVLTDSSVSRMHARLTEENGQVYLEDLNATNGTFRNGVRLKPYEKVEIWKEDEIKLGKLSFTYR